MRNRIVERFKAVVADVVISCLGAPLVERAGRFLVNQARLDFDNNLGPNGEMLLQREVANLFSDVKELLVLDVGANVGEWSVAMAGTRSAGVRIHCFEPERNTFETLRGRIDAAGLSEMASIHNVAIGEKVGRLELISYGPNQGRNSLFPVEGKPDGELQSVKCTTVDAFCSEHGIAQVHLLKIDTEGNDALVLRGAQGLLSKGSIHVIQFEYNSRWIFARSFLRDVFELVTPFGYRVGKLTPRGVLWFAGWRSRLESYQEGNYVLARDRNAAGLSSVRRAGYSE